MPFFGNREHREVNPWLIAIAVMSSTFMEVLDTTVVNVSLPHIAGSLSATNDEATWTLTSYLVANAIILPMTGWLASRFGRKRLLMMSVSGFTVASFLCGLAPSLPFLILCRVIQGAAAAGCSPCRRQSCWSPSRRKARTGNGLLGAGHCRGANARSGRSAAGSPTTTAGAGSFTSTFRSGSWRSSSRSFSSSTRRTSRKEKRGIDYWGIGLLAVGMGSLQVMLDKGQEDDWFGSHFIVILARARGSRT